MATYLRSQPIPPRPAPILSRGAVAWVRANLFNGWLGTILTLGSIALVIWLLPGLVRFMLIDAVWSAPDGAACRAPGAGACWAFVAQKLDFFRYGAYPEAARWRVDATLMLGAVLIARLLWQAKTRSLLAACALILGVPLFTILLTPGYAIALQDPVRGAAMLCGGALLGAMLWFGQIRTGLVALGFFVIYPVIAFLLLHGSRTLGLSIIDTSLWGGLFVTLLISIVGIVASLPLGILLALGRRSDLPIVKTASSVFIEVVRGVPLITVLFMANTMLPLFVPEHLAPDRLLRPLIGVALFASAYMAETIRAGLQALPKGQYEGAMALGLSHWSMLRLVILPQALVMVIPGIVNSFISLFKDTTLVAVVGIFDFLRAVDSARLDPAWAGPTISTSAYVFAALFYWVFCFGMSRYSIFMEHKLSAGQRR